MGIKDSYKKYLQEEIQMAAAAQDIDLLCALMEECEDLDVERVEERAEESAEGHAPPRRTEEPAAWEQAVTGIMAVTGIIVMVAVFLALCAAPDRW
jgi:5'-deoxynucleotidase YfbR-like HD superfamily hydrolase